MGIKGMDKKEWYEIFAELLEATSDEDISELMDNEVKAFFDTRLNSASTLDELERARQLKKIFVGDESCQKKLH